MEYSLIMSRSRACEVQRKHTVWSVLYNVRVNVSRATLITANLLATCVKSQRDKQKERQRERKSKNTAVQDMPSVAGMLSHCPLNMTKSSNIFYQFFISFHIVHVHILVSLRCLVWKLVLNVRKKGTAAVFRVISP